MNLSVATVIPYSPEHTSEGMLLRAKESVRAQSVPTEIITIEESAHKGPAWARNAGMRATEADFVAFLDADDVWYPDKLEKQLKAMDKHGVGICVEGNCEEENKKIDTTEFIEGLLFGELESLTSSILIDRRLVSVQFREELERLEDHLFMIESALQSGVCAVDGPIVENKKHAGGLSAQGTAEKMYRSRFKLAAYLQQHDKTEEYADRLRWLACYALGKQQQFRGDVGSALSPLIQSLHFGIRTETLRALATTPWYLAERIVRSGGESHQ